MQLLIAFAACIFAATAMSAGDMRNVMALKEQCVEETGVDPGILERSRNGEEIDDEKLRCFGACVFKTIGAYNEDGTINKEVVIENLPESVPRDAAVTALDKCADEKGETDCDTGFRIFECIRRTAHIMEM